MLNQITFEYGPLTEMDKEFLEDYEQKEKAEIDKLLTRIEKGRFDFERDAYPPDERFVKLQKPIATSHTWTIIPNSIWCQIPFFCGSILLTLPPIPQPDFDKYFFEISEIPEIIDFIKETGKVHITLNQFPSTYLGLDYLDPFFVELERPYYSLAPVSIFGGKKEVRDAANTFYALARLGFSDCLREIIPSRLFHGVFSKKIGTYMTLKLGHYSIAESIENYMVDNPRLVIDLLAICKLFITDPVRDLRSTLSNFPKQLTEASQVLPLVYQPQETRFPYEVGKFLLEKLTYAPEGLRACYNLIDNYDDYDLQQVQKSLNEAIVINHPDSISKSVDDLSEILDNIWNDPTIPRRIKNLRKGLPISMAAIGTAVSTIIGGFEGFLAGLGFSVGAKFVDIAIEGLSEKIVKFFARSHQINIYDFQSKYKGKIRTD